MNKPITTTLHQETDMEKWKANRKELIKLLKSEPVIDALNPTAYLTLLSLKAEICLKTDAPLAEIRRAYTTPEAK